MSLETQTKSYSEKNSHLLNYVFCTMHICVLNQLRFWNLNLKRCIKVLINSCALLENQTHY